MTSGKTIALTRWTFVGKVMSLLLNMLSRLVITFLPRSKHLLISWLHYIKHLKFFIQLEWYSPTVDPQAACHQSPHKIMTKSMKKYSFGMLTELKNLVQKI